MLGKVKTAMILTARGPEQQSRGVDNVLAFVNLALALGKGRQAGLRVWLPDRTGKRAGRPRARPESRPTSRIPSSRQSGTPRSHSEDLGRRRGISPRPAVPRTRCSTRWAPTKVFARCSYSAPILRCPHLVQDISRNVWMRSISSWFLTSSYLKRRRAPMSFFPRHNGRKSNTDDHRGPRPASQASDYTAPGSAHRLRDSHTRLGTRLGCGDRFPSEPQEVFEELRRAQALVERPTMPGSPMTVSNARRGVFWPCPSLSNPGTPRLFLDRFGHANQTRALPCRGVSTAC